MRTVLRAAGIGVAGIGLLGAVAANALPWMVFTGSSGGDWGVAGNWTNNALGTDHHVPGSSGADFTGQVSAKTVYVNNDFSANLVTMYKFDTNAICEIQAGGVLGAGAEVYDTSQVNVRSGGSISGGGWWHINTFAGSTVAVGNLSSGVSNLSGGSVTINGSLNGGSVIQNGASMNITAWTMLSNGAYYQLQSGTMANNNLAIGRSGATLASLTMTGGTVTAGQTMIAGGGDTGNGLLDISAGSFSGGPTQIGNSASGTGKLKITGSAATIGVSSLTVGANGTLEYIFGPAGVSKITDSGATTLTGSTLKVDVTGYAETGIIDLLSYAGARTGSFGTVTIQSYDTVRPWTNLLDWGTPVANPLLMPQGYYYLNTGAASNGKVTLLFNVPEPGALALLALGGLALLRRRR